MIFLYTLCPFAFANSIIELGKPLPGLTISEGGAIYFDDEDDRHLRPWSTQELLKHKRIIQYLPGRLSSRQNLHLNEAAHSIDHPHHCRTISIINSTDSIPGTWIFIQPEMARTKKLTPLCDIILDKMGIGEKLWNLPKEKIVTIVTNELGVVEFYFEGKLSDKQVELIIDLSNPPGIKRPEKMIKKITF